MNTDIELGERIAYGVFGNVTKAMYQGKEIVLSRLLLRACPQSFYECRHPNLLSIYGVDERKNLMIEYVQYTTLADVLFDREQRDYTLKQAINWMQQAAEGLFFLHNMTPKLISLDFETTTLLLTQNLQCLKIGGTPFCLENDQLPRHERVCHMAPEVFNGDPVTEACDVYKFGEVLWQVMTRKNDPYLFADRRECPPISEVLVMNTDDIKALIEKCCQKNPILRPSINDVSSILNLFVESSTSETLEYIFTADIGSVVSCSTINLTEDMNIGEGTFGKCYKTTWYNKSVVIKEFKKLEKTSEKSLKNLKRIIAIATISAPNLIGLVLPFGIIIAHDRLSLIMEYADCGSLYQRIYGKNNQPYTEKTALNWMNQAMDAVTTLHQLRCFVHGNIKPQNMMLYDNFKSLKIGDWCTIFEHSTLYKHNHHDIDYIAPETMDKGCYTRESDIYSLGIVFWEILAQRKPFDHIRSLKRGPKITKIIEGERPRLEDIKFHNMDYELLLNSCWDPTPENRHIIKDLENFCENEFNLPKSGDKNFEISEFTTESNENIANIVNIGSYGAELKVNWINEEKTVVLSRVCKMIKNNAEKINNIISEVQRLITVEHVNISAIFGYTSHSKFLYVITEYEQCGSLHNCLHVDRIDYNVQRAVNWILGLAKGLEYMHAMKPSPMIHGNLKSQCLQLTNNYTDLKISGFWTDSTELSVMTAPEVVNSRQKTKASDIYCFGIVWCEVLTRQKPQKNNGESMVDAIPETKFKHMKPLIISCLNKSSEKRPLIEKLTIILSNIKSIEELPAEIQSNMIESSDFHDIKVAARGSFGDVKIAKWRDHNVALKMFISINQEENIPQFQYHEKEIAQLLCLKHNNIVTINAITFDIDYVYLVMEYSDCGTLYTLVHDESEKYTIEQAFDWIDQLIEGIEYMHSVPLIHGDLKTSCVFLFKENRIVKIGGFGTEASEESLLIAPEIIDDDTNSEESDVYSFGIILWEIMSRKEPFYHLEHLPTYKKQSKICKEDNRPPLDDIKKSNFDNKLTTTERCWEKDYDNISFIIESCWQKDLKKRPVGKLSYLFSHVKATDKLCEMLNIWEIEFGEKIGQGGFGTVLKALWRKQYVAVKTLNKNIDKEAMTKFDKEIKQLSRVNHENIVKLYGITADKNNIYLVMEYAECGSLHDRIHKSSEGYTVKDAINWMYQCAKGIAHLHGMSPKMIHRDLKPDNLLLTNECRILKIGDFGTVVDLKTLMTGGKCRTLYGKVRRIQFWNYLLGGNETEKAFS
ncbi:uncharacterized protein LOC108607953 isoform X2 [Drosophila busckii]|uniref:uncharacterized protein LOC108607953 isoform X2 n=1 Tax=Drosophila busckii TaxID=30019 RepID=UPI0014333763|nr:uncharacterized protein LOC108607953 isoform X2 [Drosophila busckii]